MCCENGPAKSVNREMFPVDITTNGKSLEDGGTVVNEIATKQGGNFFIGGYSFTHKTCGKKVDTYLCTHNRNPCSCRMGLYFTRATGRVDLFIRDKTATDEEKKNPQHNEACEQRTALH